MKLIPGMYVSFLIMSPLSSYGICQVFYVSSLTGYDRSLRVPCSFFFNSILRPELPTTACGMVLKFRHQISFGSIAISGLKFLRLPPTSYFTWFGALMDIRGSSSCRWKGSWEELILCLNCFRGVTSTISICLSSIFSPRIEYAAKKNVDGSSCFQAL